MAAAIASASSKWALWCFSLSLSLLCLASLLGLAAAIPPPSPSPPPPNTPGVEFSLNGYYLLSSGYCPAPITTAADCNAAAATLGLSRTYASTTNYWNHPRSCILILYGGQAWNSAGTSFI